MTEGEGGRAQLLTVIADFLELGHVENIVAMFRRDPSCLALSGDLIQSERFMVRMGMAVLFEDLRRLLPEEILADAVPSLAAALANPAPYVRGDAAYVLAIIGSRQALAVLAPLANDPDPQVAEIAREALAPAA